jgi:hypothetical protein
MAKAPAKGFKSFEKSSKDKEKGSAKEGSSKETGKDRRASGGGGGSKKKGC